MRAEDHEEKILAGLTTPDPPPEVRVRTVRAARAALGEAPRAGAWERLWRSRPLRLAWAASVIALLAAHVLVTLHHRAGNALPAGPPSAAAQAADPELRGLAALPRIDLNARALGGGQPRSAAPPTAPGARGGPARTHAEENRS